MQTISINFQVPQVWHELGDKQLRYIYLLLAENFSADEIKTLACYSGATQRLSTSNPPVHICSVRAKPCSRLHLSLSLNCSRLSLGSTPFRISLYVLLASTVNPRCRLTSSKCPLKLSSSAIPTLNTKNNRSETYFAFWSGNYIHHREKSPLGDDF